MGEGPAPLQWSSISSSIFGCLAEPHKNEIEDEIEIEDEKRLVLAPKLPPHPEAQNSR